MNAAIFSTNALALAFDAAVWDFVRTCARAKEDAQLPSDDTADLVDAPSTGRYIDHARIPRPTRWFAPMQHPTNGTYAVRVVPLLVALVDINNADTDAGLGQRLVRGRFLVWGQRRRGRRPRPVRLRLLAGDRHADHAVDRLTFKVGDTVALRSVMVWAKYPDGRSELIYDGDAFEPEFATYSSITAGTFGSLVGFTLVVRRYHGWPAMPEIRVRATDRGGNEAA
jgi:hypothetical protein